MHLQTRNTRCAMVLKCSQAEECEKWKGPFGQTLHCCVVSAQKRAEDIRRPHVNGSEPAQSGNI